jgi:plasmid stabilization system protein ParE
MAATVVFHRLATQEYREARKWYAARSSHVAGRFGNAVDATVSRIAADPELLPLLVGSYRWSKVRGFPYLLVFRRRNDETVIVVAVAHGRRKFGYWRRRM